MNSFHVIVKSSSKMHCVFVLKIHKVEYNYRTYKGTKSKPLS